MSPYELISLDRRFWILDRVGTLRDELSIEHRQQLLEALGKMSWGEWIERFVVDIDAISGYAQTSLAGRKKILKSKGVEGLLLHHAAMFITGFTELAKVEGFPLEPYRRKSERFGYEISAMTSAIKVWEGIEKHVEYSLYWLFDEPVCESRMPFKD